FVSGIVNALARTVSCFIVVELQIDPGERAALRVSQRGPRAVSSPRLPGQTERRRRRSPHGQRTGTAYAWPPAPPGSPPAPAKDGSGRGLPPRGRVRSRCANRDVQTRP